MAKKSAEPKRLSMRAAAAAAGMSHSTASRIAARLGLGVVVNDRRTGLTAADVETLKAESHSGPGNPNMIAGSEHQSAAGKLGAKARWKRKRK